MMNPLRPQDREWIEKHSWWFTGINRTLPREEYSTLFSIYSWVTGKTQKYSSCGRCVISARECVWNQYKKT